VWAPLSASRPEWVPREPDIDITDVDKRRTDTKMTALKAVVRCKDPLRLSSPSCTPESKYAPPLALPFSNVAGSAKRRPSNAITLRYIRITSGHGKASENPDGHRILALGQCELDRFHFDRRPMLRRTSTSRTHCDARPPTIRIVIDIRSVPSTGFCARRDLQEALYTNQQIHMRDAQRDGTWMTSLA